MIIFATIAHTSSSEGKSFSVGDLAPINLPENCTVHSADHIGIGTADLARLLAIALSIGRHVNANELQILDRPVAVLLSKADLLELGRIAEKADSDASIASTLDGVHVKVEEG
jgi:hypothetical protein